MNIEGFQLLNNKNQKSLLGCTGIVVRNNLQTIFNSFDYAKKIGGFEYTKRNNTDSLLKFIRKEKEIDYTSYKLSLDNIDYLKKIVAICLKGSRRIIVIRSPLHKKSEEINNEKIFQNVLASNFSTIEFLDFKDFPLENNEYGDLEHLNYKGARKFSIFFDRLLKSDLLSCNDKQKFINDEMEKLKIRIAY